MESWNVAELDIKPHHPEVLCTDEDTRAIAINLPAGEMMQEHEVHENTYLLVAEGEVEIAEGGQTTTGVRGALFHFAPHERREVRATSDARIVMILAPYPAPTRRS